MTLQAHRLRSMEQVRAFVEGNQAVDYEHRDRPFFGYHKLITCDDDSARP